MPKCREPTNGSEALILSHLHVVHDIAKSVRGGLPAQADFNDLVGAGMLGLVDAARKFDPKRRTSFRTYAKHRIRGAIMDSLRAIDPLSRDMRKNHRTTERVTQELTGKLKREPTEEEIAGTLKIPLDRWRRLTRELHQAGCAVNGRNFSNGPTALVENVPAVNGNPERRAAQTELRPILEEAIRTLPPRYQKVIALYYGREQTMKQIGRELGVNESRISQIHSAALAKLRCYLTTSGFDSKKLLG